MRMKPHNIMLPDPLYAVYEGLAKEATKREGRQVSTAEMIRRALERGPTITATNPDGEVVPFTLMCSTCGAILVGDKYGHGLICPVPTCKSNCFTEEV